MYSVLPAEFGGKGDPREIEVVGDRSEVLGNRQEAIGIVAGGKGERQLTATDSKEQGVRSKEK
jgi:hypothetical protein